MDSYIDQQLISISKNLYEASKREIFAGLMVKAGIGTYPFWNFSKNARQARARRKTLWKDNKAEIERRSLERVMEHSQGVAPDVLERILKEIQGS